MSNEREKEYDSLMDKLAEEYLARELKNATGANAENLSFVYTYKNTLNLVRLSENLVKQSSMLSWLTKVLIVTSVGMFVLAIAQLKVMLSP